MKFRRMIAILLMTLANVFMLAHAIMPHHHHEGLVFFSAEKECCSTTQHSCSDHMECCTDSEAETEKEHQTHHDNCDLPQQVERDGRSINEGFSSFQLKKDITDSCLCILCYVCNQSVVELDEITLGKYKRYTEYTETYTSPYVGAIFGLRAPPAISLL